MSFLSKVLKVATGGLSGPIGSLMKGDVKGAGIGALTGGLMGGGRRGPGGMGPQPVDPGAQSYLDSFSPEDQGSIRGSWGSNPNGQNDWFKNAQAAGVPMGAPPAAPPQPGADPSQLGAAMAGMGAPPDQMAQDVRNERRKFRMGRMGGGAKVPGGARPGGFTGMGIGAPRDDGMWSRPGME